MSTDVAEFIASLREELAQAVADRLDVRPLLTKEEAAARLNVKLRKLEYMIQRGEIASVKIGERSVRIEAAEIDRVIAAGRVDSEDGAQA